MKRLTDHQSRYTLFRHANDQINIPHFLEQHLTRLACGYFCVSSISPMHCKSMALFVAEHQKSEYCLQVFECAPDKRLGLLYGEIVTGDWSTIRIADICKQVQACKRSAGYTITGNYPHSSGNYGEK